MHEFSPARLAVAADLPPGSGCVYEPKFDGYRCLLGKDPDGRPFALSRNPKDLGRDFTALRYLAEGLPPGSVVDGEVVKLPALRVAPPGPANPGLRRVAERFPAVRADARLDLYASPRHRRPLGFSIDFHGR